MSDASAPHASDSEPKQIEGTDEEPLWQRFLYMLGFWLLGYVAFNISILMAAVQLVVVLVTGEKNQDLRGFSRNLVQYLWECLAFITFVRDEKPFPFGKFPSVKTED